MHPSMHWRQHRRRRRKGKPKKPQPRAAVPHVHGSFKNRTAEGHLNPKEPTPGLIGTPRLCHMCMGVLKLHSRGHLHLNEPTAGSHPARRKALPVGEPGLVGDLPGLCHMLMEDIKGSSPFVGRCHICMEGFKSAAERGYEVLKIFHRRGRRCHMCMVLV